MKVPHHPAPSFPLHPAGICLPSLVLAQRSRLNEAPGEMHSPMVHSGHVDARDVTLSAAAEGNGFPPVTFTVRQNR